MSDCICLYGSEGDLPEFYDERWVVARKPHTCHECRRPIAIGQRYYRVTGKWDGDVNSFRICADCQDIQQSLYCDGSYSFGTLWSDIEDQLFPTGGVNTACLDKLATADAKQYLAQRWWTWVQEQS